MAGGRPVEQGPRDQGNEGQGTKDKGPREQGNEGTRNTCSLVFLGVGSHGLYLKAMNILCLQTSSGRGAVLACALICLAIPASRVGAQADKPAPAADKAAAEKTAAADKTTLPPLPAEAHVQQSVTIDGKTLKYTATVGSFTARDKDGEGFRRCGGDLVYGRG